MRNHGRRKFLYSLVQESFALVNEFMGVPQYRLEDLDKISVKKFNQLVPVFNPSKSIRVDNDWLQVKSLIGDESKRFCKLSVEECYILQRFDGNHSISGLCNCLIADFRIEKDKAFTMIRNLFLRLAKANICQPAGTGENLWLPTR